VFSKKIRHKINISNDLKELEKISGAIEIFSETADLNTKTTISLGIILDELLSNIIFYSFQDDKTHEISVSFEKSGKIIAVEIEYGGIEFDPRNAPKPDLESPADKRKIGGLGIHIVLKMTYYFDYRRKKGINTILFKLKIDKE
jgi:anti-sigma regulatory factor (Ser/Thr protein kinase)